MPMAAAAACPSIPALRPCTLPSTTIAACLYPVAARSEADTTLGFLRDALAFYQRHGIQVRALLTDNGSSYRSHIFARPASSSSIQHRRTRPYTPRTNGKAERFIQTALHEWAYAKHWKNSDERDQHLQPWTAYYNFAKIPW